MAGTVKPAVNKIFISVLLCIEYMLKFVYRGKGQVKMLYRGYTIAEKFGYWLVYKWADHLKTFKTNAEARAYVDKLKDEGK